MATFPLRDVDFKLIEAAIRLTDWLAQRCEAGPQVIKCLHNTRDVLQRLPEVTEDVSCGFAATIADACFRQEHKPLAKAIEGFNRFWGVDYTAFHYDRPFLSLHSGFCDEPRPTDFRQEITEELNFALFAGGPEHLGDYNFHRWIAEVTDLIVFLRAGRTLEINADYELRRTSA